MSIILPHDFHTSILKFVTYVFNVGNVLYNFWSALDLRSLLILLTLSLLFACNFARACLLRRGLCFLGNLHFANIEKDDSNGAFLYVCIVHNEELRSLVQGDDQKIETHSITGTWGHRGRLLRLDRLGFCTWFDVSHCFWNFSSLSYFKILSFGLRKFFTICFLEFTSIRLHFKFKFFFLEINYFKYLLQILK